MDGAQARNRYLTIFVELIQECVGGRGRCDDELGASLKGTPSSADLGGSSKYSSENLEN